MKQWMAALLTVVWFAAGVAFGQSKKAHAFVDPSLIITAEVGGKSEMILNLINLGDNLLVFESKNLIVKSRGGRTSIGQVIDQSETDNKGNTWRYRASMLLQPRTSQGFSVLGAFGDLNQIETVLVRMGGKLYHLEPLGGSEFDSLASKVSDLDLKAPDFKKALESANIWNLGKQQSATEQTDTDLRSVLTSEGVNPPKIIERPAVAYTPEAQKAGIEGVVHIAGTISRDGNFANPKVVKGLGHGLDERALEVVRNSWKFLPATKDGEVVESTVTIEVAFQPSK